MGEEIDRDPGQQVKQDEVPQQREATDPANKGSPARDEDGAVASLDLVKFDLSQT